MNKTKRFVVGVLSVLCFIAVSSCSKPKTNDELIIGKWKLKSVSSFYESNGAITISSLDPEEIIKGLVWEFTSGGYVYDAYGARATYTVDDDYLTITEGHTSLWMHIDELTKDYMGLKYRENATTHIHLYFLKN